jgi:hypothetical protein
MNRTLFGEPHPQVAANLNNLGLLARDRGDYAAVGRFFEQAVAMDRSRFGPGNIVVARGLNSWAESLRLGGDPRRVEGPLRGSLAIHSSVLPAGHWRTAAIRTLIARCLIDQRRFTKAERLLLAVHPVVDAEFGPGHRR